MRKGNGGIIGARRLPSPLAASGVWGVQDAYTADRDAQWSRWPADVGIPFDGRLRMWLEADYGLYQDVDATVPVTADNQSVRSWVNRGNAGKLVCSKAVAPKRGVLNNKKTVDFASSAIDMFDILTCDRRSYNHAFVLYSNTGGTSAQRCLITGPETTANNALKSAPALSARQINLDVGLSLTSGSVMSPGVNTTVNQPCISSHHNSIYLPSASKNAMVATRDSLVTPTTQTEFIVPPGQAGISVGGVGGLSVANFLRMHALIWYSADEPLSVAECNLVYAYLGTKYGAIYPVLA